MIGPITKAARVGLIAAVGLAACHAPSPAAAPGAARPVIDADPSAAGQTRLEASMSPAMLALAARLDKVRWPDLGGRTPGWAVLDVVTPPTLGFGALSPEAAERVNAFLPAVSTPPPAVPPFVLKAAGPERDRALLCLTQAIYYEAALEPTGGQEAVAQTVLNRVRHPAFPHSICGVVYEGSQQATGCQFSFTCDGSRQRPPIAPFWQRAQAVARQALDGFVMPSVGTATAYHADYVFPRWGPTLVKIAQIGAQIFYRFPGPAGLPGAFRRSYGGDELRVSMAGPPPAAILAARGGALPGSGQTVVRTYAWADASAPGGMHIEPGQVVFGHRAPTRDEIARINATLLALEKRQSPLPAHPAPAALSDDQPVGQPQ